MCFPAGKRGAMLYRVAYLLGDGEFYIKSPCLKAESVKKKLNCKKNTKTKQFSLVFWDVHVHNLYFRWLTLAFEFFVVLVADKYVQKITKENS